MLKQYSTEDWCFFKNDDDQWCFFTTPPILSVGWNNTQEFKQTTDAEPLKYYDYTLSIWAQAQAFVQSSFFISTIYKNELQAYISKFAADVFFTMIVNGNYQVCLGTGWETEEIDFDVAMSMKLNDCYKVIITDLCDFSSSWNGYNSKYID